MDSPFVTHRHGNRLAERDAQIFDQMMIIDVRIALGFQRQIEAPVLGERFEHVIEKRNSRRNVGIPAAI